MLREMYFESKLFIYHTLDDDLSEVGVTGALLAAPNDVELLPKLPFP